MSIFQIVNHSKTGQENVQLLNVVSGFQMVGFWIPIVITKLTTWFLKHNRRALKLKNYKSCKLKWIGPPQDEALVNLKQEMNAKLQIFLLSCKSILIFYVYFTLHSKDMKLNLHSTDTKWGSEYRTSPVFKQWKVTPVVECLAFKPFSEYQFGFQRIKYETNPIID